MEMYNLATGFITAFVAIWTSHTFVVCLGAWAVAQVIKLVWDLLKTRKWHWHLLAGTGGMPSSHMTLVSCFSILMGLERGWGDPLFQSALVLAIIVASDAWGARRAAGIQAGVINRIVTDYYRKAKNRPKHLRELIGHNPLEVWAGAALGISMAYIFHVHGTPVK